MARFSPMLLFAVLVCTAVIVGCWDAEGSLEPTVTPKSARDLPTLTPVPPDDRSQPVSAPSEDKRPPQPPKEPDG